MNKNKQCWIITVLFLSVLLPSVLIAQEQLTFVVVRDTVIVNENTHETIMIQIGDIITTNAEVVFDHITFQGETRHHLLIIFGEPSNSYAVFAKDFRPANTEDVFGEDIFIDHSFDRFDSTISSASGAYIVISDVDAMWVPYYYSDILLSQSRDSLLEIHPYFINYADSGFFWYESSEINIRHGRAMFYSSVIMLGSERHFAVRNIKKTDFGYIVDCVMSTRDGRIPEWSETSGTSFWDTYWSGDAVTLLLHIDGDYLDIYTVGTNIHVGTFIRVGREFITQYQSLIRTNTADLTNVQWPRRAEGSTGIPPVFVLPDNFRNETLEVTDESVTNDFEDQESAIVQNDTSANSLPLWVWLAIIGGVVVAGGVFFVVVRRKR
jgi:hypothetical protein